MNFQQEIEELCEDLSKIQIRRIGIDSILSVYLGITYVNRFRKLKLSTLFKELVGFVIKFVVSRIKTPTRITWKPLPLITFVSDRPHIYNMSYTLVDRFSNNVNLYWALSKKPTFKIQGSLVRKDNIIFPLRIGRDPGFKNAFINSLRIFFRFLKKNNLSRLRVIPFGIHLYYQLAYITFFETQFENSRPNAIITEHDRYNEIACLVIAARHQGIRTITQVHGALNSKSSYAPLISDIIGCWGEWQKQRLLSWGVAESSIKITGATQLNGSVSTSESNILENSILKNKKIVLLATNPTNSIIRVLVKEFSELLNELGDGFIGVIRLHPSENFSDYNVHLEGSNVFIDSQLDVERSILFNNAEVIVVFNSAFAFDALLQNKKVFKLDVAEEIKSAIDELVDKGIIRRATNGKELANLIMQEQDILNSKRADYYLNFRENYCKYFGSEATEQFEILVNNF